jgi:hypothetical protein
MSDPGGARLAGLCMNEKVVAEWRIHYKVVQLLMCQTSDHTADFVRSRGFLRDYPIHRFWSSNPLHRASDRAHCLTIDLLEMRAEMTIASSTHFSH